MRPSDERFRELYNQYEIDPADLPREEEIALPMMRAYEHVLEKAGLPRPVRRSRKKYLLAAAVAATALLTIAAAYYSVNDAFRGVVTVHESAPHRASASAPVSSRPILERSGTLLGERAVSGNVEMALRAALGDEHHIKLLVDVTDTTGKPLAITQADGTLSRDNYSLRDYDLQVAGGSAAGSAAQEGAAVDFGFVSYSASMTFIDPDPADNKLTILLEYSAMDESVRGKQLTLHIRDLLQQATVSGTALDMAPDDLFGIVSAFGGHTDADFERNGYTEESGVVEYSYTLATDTDKRLPLSADTGVRVTNAAVRGGVLYLRGTADSAEELERILENVALVNKRTGKSIPWAACGQGDEPRNWTMEFAGVDSAEALRGFVWHCGEGYNLHTAAAGEWDFAFTVRSDDSTVALSPMRAIEWEGHPLTVESIALSPLTLCIAYSTDAATAERMLPTTEWGVYSPPSAWAESAHPVTLHLRDGSRIEVRGNGLQGSGENRFRMDYVLDVVVDPAEVTGIELGGETFAVGQA